MQGRGGSFIFKKVFTVVRENNDGGSFAIGRSSSGVLAKLNQ